MPEGCVQFSADYFGKTLQMLVLSPGLLPQEARGDWSIKKNWIDKQCLV